MSFLGGAFAIIGNPLAGWLSDRRGRRPITALFALGVGAAAIAFYSMSGATLPLLWMGLIFFSLGSNVTQSTYSAEMFPTRLRSTAASGKALMSDLGGIAGLAMVSALFTVAGSNWSAISILAACCIAVPVIVLLVLPETAGRPLETIAPEEAAADVAQTERDP
jgi:putative MFS transporter